MSVYECVWCALVSGDEVMRELWVFTLFSHASVGW